MAQVFKLLSQSLVARVYTLYTVTLLLFIGSGLALFYRVQLLDHAEASQASAAMLVEVAAQAVTDNAVIGDYDSIRRLLDKAIVRSPFASADFIDLEGGHVRSSNPQLEQRRAPDWLYRLVAEQLYDVNRNISAGGRDYGVLRLSFGVDQLAEDLWRLAIYSAQLALAGFVGGAVLIWFPLRRWLGAVQRVRAFETSMLQGAEGAQHDAARLMESLPVEFRHMFALLERTAASLRRELQTREQALTSMRRAVTVMLDDGAPAQGGSDDLAVVSDSLLKLLDEREQSRQALLRAKEAAEEASRIKSEFLANMSHEIRTPMNCIIGMTDFVLETPLSQQQAEFVGMIKQSADALLAIINDILDFSRIEAGKLHMEPVACDVRQVFTDTLRPLAFQAESKGLALRVELAPALPERIMADPVRLRQILVNMVGNAVKFTEKGHVRVQCALDATPPARLLVTVEDTGIGIPPDKLRQIFDAFNQGDGSTTRRYGGTGLGLTITRSLVGLMSGRLHVDSTPGQGSRFTCELPCVLPDDSTLPAPAMLAAPVAGAEPTAPTVPTVPTVPAIPPASAMASAPPAPAMPATPAPPPAEATAPLLLLVEDYPINQLLATKLLERRGYAVSVAEDGAAAVQAFQAGKFAAVLMDLQMPGMSGLEATAEIRRWERQQGRAATPIIAMTASTIPGERERCMAAGMNGYVSKPINKDILYAELAAALATAPA